LQAIADELECSKSSVSLWVRDIPFTPSKRRWGPHRRPNPASFRKQAEIEEMNRWGADRLGELDEVAFLSAGAALYAGEGDKRDGMVKFSNSDPAMRVTRVPRDQFRAPYRADPDPSIRRNKHELGCAYVYYYCCSRTHRAIMGLVRALLSSESHSGVAQLVARRIVNPTV
jgi:hypothetical protein